MRPTRPGCIDTFSKYIQVLFRNQDKNLLSGFILYMHSASSSVDRCLAEILDDSRSVKESSSGSIGPAEIPVALNDIVASQAGLRDAAECSAT